ncbi:hypothetical protein AMYX_11830 [Anaeromyxobacter diazotrophicus]|uniref:Uncharacterized protein n=1 Tax=Anaeromyxobacter diazotrophicus TaxID=2590199 RepID=A0A7I9VJ53_9BACT|nr:hypothetical protein AMYX_11830 [Anaeromyxobacter diazotrophicus]
MEQELDLGVALVAGQLGQAVEEGDGVEGSRRGVGHGETSGACSLTVTRTLRASGKALVAAPARLREVPADFALDGAEHLAGPGRGALEGDPVALPGRARDSAVTRSSAKAFHRWGVRCRPHHGSPSEHRREPGTRNRLGRAAPPRVERLPSEAGPPARARPLILPRPSLPAVRRPAKPTDGR